MCYKTLLIAGYDIKDISPGIKAAVEAHKISTGCLILYIKTATSTLASEIEAGKIHKAFAPVNLYQFKAWKIKSTFG